MFGFGAQTQPGFQSFLGLPLAYEVSVGAVIFRRTVDGNIEYLLLRYPHGHWDYVKGHIESGETHEETLRRETQEESGIVSIDIQKNFRKCTHYFYTAKGTELVKRKQAGDGIWIFKTVHFYLAEALDTDISISDEHIGFSWVAFEEAINKLTFSAAKDILTSADVFLRKV
jgi:8-oxo-dGTP pyrophosphatase MutT (NUDIX family)